MNWIAARESGERVQAYRSGMIALAGRPNVGKSTLVNQIVGEKVSIVSRRPQTTRYRIRAIQTREEYQMVFVDAPGIHEPRRAIDRAMVNVAVSSFEGVDVILFLVEALRWRQEDQAILDRLQRCNIPVVLAVNKVDRVCPKEKLLPFLKEMEQRFDFAAQVPIAAYRGTNLATLETELQAYLPPGPAYFPGDQVTDRSLRFLCGERIREQVFHQLGQELPYSADVQIERFEETSELIRIHATILVEQESQKAIFLGRGGRRIKQLGSRARRDLEAFLEGHVYLELFVRVHKEWTSDERTVRKLGYGVDF